MPEPNPPPEQTRSIGTILTTRDLTRRFGGLAAVNRVAIGI